MSDIRLKDIKINGGTQMRSSLDDGTIQDYAELMQDGVKFPPIVLFYDGESYWLADGFHRYHATLKTESRSIGSDVKSGSRIDAIKYALSANATNGKARSRDDMRRAYDVAVANDLCSPTDSAAVKSLIGCSDRWARELTKSAREYHKAERDKRIIELSGEGKSQREIANDVGVDHKTVGKALYGEKRNSSEPPQSFTPEHKEQPESRGVGIKYAHDAIAVLKRIPPSDGLRDDALGMVLDWINTNRR